MRIDRVVMTVGAMLLAGSVVAGCSGADPEPDRQVTVGGGEGKFTPAEQEVVDAVDGYTSAFYGRGTSSVESAVKNRVTGELAKLIVPAEKKAVDDQGLEYLGDVTIEPETVTIDGDKATFTGCQDGTGVFLVEAGETTVPVGATPVNTATLTYGLVREGDTWLIDDPRSERVNAC